MAADSTFIDTNVLLYALDRRAVEKAPQAAAWLQYLWESQTGRCSWQVLDEFYANAVRKVGVPAKVARETIGAYVAWQPVGSSLAIVERAWFWCDAAQVTYWDGKILAAAERLGCRWLLSEDFTAGRTYGSVTVINPFLTSPPK